MFFITIIILLPVSIFGYLDPGSGSILVYFIIGLFATLMYSLKNFIFNIQTIFARIFSKNKIDSQRKNIVFYSEGGHYWEVFRSVIEKLTKMGVKCSYYASDKQDKGLDYKSEYCDVLFIGDSQLSVMSLNYLNAKILVMTTPQIDVMYLKKSKRVDYFVNLVHMPDNIFKLEPFSFDFFDCVMCAGQHQINDIRLIEQMRVLPPKTLLKTGLTYFDGLLKNKINKKSTDKKIILVAPTWGNFGLLNKVGFEIFDILLKTNFDIILRPHPQSFVNDTEMMDEIIQKSKQYKQIEIDTRPSPTYAMNQADIMISDISGIIFDFAFVYEKPIIVFNNITNDDKFVELNAVRNYHKIDKQMWGLEVMDQVANIIDINELSSLENIINKTIKSDNKKIIELKNKSIYSYGHAGDVCAKQLVNLLEKDIK